MLARLPIAAGCYQNTDDIGLVDVSPTFIDGYIDEFGNIHRRPGTALFCDLGTNSPVDGIWYWSNKNIILAVSAGKLFKVQSDGTTTELIGATLKQGVRPTFATDGVYAYVANGGMIVMTPGTSYSKYLPNPNVPSRVTHVAWMDKYLLANEVNSAKIQWSHVGTSTVWDGDYAEAEGDPDFIKALHVGWRELGLFGPKSVEFWYDDGVSPFRRIEGGLIQIGCSAPYSVVQADNSWFWLDDNRKIIKLTGRTPTIISTPYDKIIQGFEVVQDCLADHVKVGGHAYLVFTFPTAQKTLVYNYMLGHWYEWGLWDEVQARHFHFIGNCHTYAEGWNTHLTGSRKSGKIMYMTPTIPSDL